MISKEKAVVYFADLRADSRTNLLNKIDSLMTELSLGERFSKGNMVAIKMHFGEKGNTSYVSPVYAARVAKSVKDTGALTFFTDTSTLYVGSRGNAVSHLKCAVGNGFAESVIGAPIIIADGLRGEAGKIVEVDGAHFKEVHIAREIVASSGLVVLSHFKCHEMTGFGGALKNVGMGCAAREGKLAQHSNCSPKVNPDGCNACGECVLVCPADAIDMGRVALINEATCIGCGHCIAACPEGTINVVWDETTSGLQEKMVEHVAGVLKGKEEKVVYINFITQVSPFCDCYGHNDAPIVPDIGIVASTDIVAIDQASADMVNGAQGFKDTALKSGHEPGGDKFRGVHASVDWTVQLKLAEEMGLGTRDYTIKSI
jgi:uncharacterized Fe-S center protein